MYVNISKGGAGGLPLQLSQVVNWYMVDHFGERSVWWNDPISSDFSWNDPFRNDFRWRDPYVEMTFRCNDPMVKCSLMKWHLVNSRCWSDSRWIVGDSLYVHIREKVEINHKEGIQCLFSDWFFDVGFFGSLYPIDNSRVFLTPVDGRFYSVLK